MSEPRIEFAVIVDGEAQCAEVHPLMLEHLNVLLQTGFYGVTHAGVLARLAERAAATRLKVSVVDDVDPMNDGESDGTP